MISGIQAVWKELTPVKESLSETIIKQNYLNMEHERQKKQEQEKAKKEADKNRKDLLNSIDAYIPGKTNIKGLDVAITRFFVEKIKPRYIEQYKIAQNKDGIYSDQEMFNAKMDLIRMKELPHLVKKTQDMFARTVAEVSAKMKTGEINAVNNEHFNDIMAKLGAGEFDIHYDEAGNLTIGNLGNLDLNGDGKSDIFSFETIGNAYNYIDDTPAFNKVTEFERFDKTYGTTDEKRIEGQADYDGKTIGKYQSQEFEGMTDKTYKMFRGDINKDYGNSISELTKRGKVFAKTHGIKTNLKKDDPDYEKNNFKFFQAKKQFADEYREKNLSKLKNNKNYSAQDSDQNRWLRAKNNKGTPTVDIRSGIQIRTDESGNLLRGRGQRVSKKGNSYDEEKENAGKVTDTYLFSVPLNKNKKPYTAVIGNKKIEIQGLSLEDNGKIYVEGTEVSKSSVNTTLKSSEKEGKKGKNTRISNSSETRSKKLLIDSYDINEVAKVFGFNNAKEFSDFLKGKRDEALGINNKNTQGEKKEKDNKKRADNYGVN